jgi:hypothetical protein
MPKLDVPTVERIIADTINETPRGDPDALAAPILAALAGAGYHIVPENGMEDTALGSQPFDELPPGGPRISTAMAGIGPSRPLSTAGTRPTICRKRSRRPMRRGAGRFMCRLPARAGSWCRGHTLPKFRVAAAASDGTRMPATFTLISREAARQRLSAGSNSTNINSPTIAHSVHSSVSPITGGFPLRLWRRNAQLSDRTIPRAARGSSAVRARPRPAPIRGVCYPARGTRCWRAAT